MRTPKPGRKAASPEEAISTAAEGNDPEAVEAKEQDAGSKDSKQRVSQKLVKEELQARADLLKELAEGYDDPGTPAATPAHTLAITPAVMWGITLAVAPAATPAIISAATLAISLLLPYCYPIMMAQTLALPTTIASLVVVVLMMTTSW